MQKYYDKKPTEVLEILKTDSMGLSQKEADLRLEKYGKNVLEADKKKSLWIKFFLQFKDVMILVLIAAALISCVVAIVEKTSSELIDGIMIFAIVLINVFLGFFQEIKAEKALSALVKMSQPFVNVIRDGKQVNIKTENLVTGDVVLLEAGDIVPADLYLIECASLKCDESALTGESVAVEKSTDISLPEDTPLGERANMCFSSSIISYGRGVGVVVATGQRAEIGKIANMLKGSKNEDTPLQKSLNKLGKIITVLVLAIAIIVFVVNIILRPDNILGSFLIAVALAVGAIPEALPATVTIIMSIGVTKLAKKSAIIKKLHAVETLGCCEVICSDKTGTITQNKMTVREFYLNGKTYSVEKPPENLAESELLFKSMLFCNDAINQDGILMGDPTETALLEYAEKQLGTKKELLKISPRVGELPFDSVRKLMTTVNKCGEKIIAYTKGAVDELITRCSHIIKNGVVKKIEPEDISLIKKANKKMGVKALRVLGFAYREIKDVGHDEKEKLKGLKISESGLIFIGLSGMMDPPREEVYQAITKCREAGMRAVMITGDHKNTAFAIAKELKIIKSAAEVLEGKELDKITDKNLTKIIHNYGVFARVSPEHKVRIVKALMASGKIVAMTGDGVNDAPSIKEANIGVGMGKSGTEVTKEVADLILTDDNFATIVVAVEEGRKIFANIQKTVQFLLSCNLAEVLTVFLLTLLFPHSIILLPIHLLFINLITDTLPAISLGIEEADKDIMKLPPRNAKKNILSGATGIGVLYQGILQFMLVAGIYILSVNLYKNTEIASTMTFLCLNIIQLFSLYNVRNSGSVFSSNQFKNKMLTISFVLGIIFVVLIATVPFLEVLFHVQNLNIIQWVITISFAFAIIPLVEIVKLIIKKHKAHKNIKVKE